MKFVPPAWPRSLFRCFPIVIFLILIQMQAKAASVIISEFMAANTSGLVDEDGDFSDWIELYNPTSSAVALAGWGLSDDSANPQKWIFPNIWIQSHAFLIVFASGKNRTN